ncbi:hypothetical protein VTN49DRAFT_1589 [Thermomyces lanuginosus]|uniref:uncharacterized protein n=1 Tax=Thermomyces lanuginosus TaxID=5541 RepID=UPI0037427238
MAIAQIGSESQNRILRIRKAVRDGRSVFRTFLGPAPAAIRGSLYHTTAQAFRHLDFLVVRVILYHLDYVERKRPLSFYLPSNTCIRIT